MTSLEIATAQSLDDLAAVRELCRTFRCWLFERYDEALVEGFYPAAEFEALLADLPRLHAPPEGAILLARLDGAPAGCGMLARFADGVCEMKRLFVGASARGRGVGRALCEALVETARRAGYRTMRLDTGPLHHEALALYETMGFAVRPSYYDPGPEWRDKHVCMERAL
jgi:GNAT superfamily N-acetyltransferase